MLSPFVRASFRARGSLRSRAFIGALLLCAAPGAGAAQQLGREELDQAVERLVAATDPPAERIELGKACLEALAGQPDGAAEQDVRLALGIALHALERLADSSEQLQVAAALARATEDEHDLAHALWLEAVNDFHLGRLDDAVEAAQEGLLAAEASRWDDAHWRLANVLGLAHERRGDATAALDAFRKGQEPAARVAERNGDTEGLAVLLGNFGIASMNLGELEEALGTFEHALELRRASGNRAGLAAAVANVGDVLGLLGRYEEARERHTEALELRLADGVEVELARSYHSLGSIHVGLGEFEAALGEFAKALEIRERLELAPDMAETLTAMAQAYASLDRDDEALESAQRGLELADQLTLKGRRRAVLETLSDVCASQGEHERALEAMTEAAELERSQRSIETHMRLAEFRAQFAAMEREQEIALLTRERELQGLALAKRRNERNALLLGGALVTLAAVAGWYAWASLRHATRRIQKLELERTRAERLESIGVLAGGIAHDFNNILSIVLGNLSLLRRSTPEGDSSHELLDDVDVGLERGAQLATQLLSLAKGGAFVRELRSIGSLVQESATFALSGSSSRAELDVDPRLWCGEVDAGQVQQLISNVVLNAGQSMPAGGVVEVRAENTRLDADNPQGLAAGPYVRITVADHGTGIDPAIRDRVFDPYFTTKEQGSGLGLALAHAIAERHGGSIDLRPGPGGGTLVEILLPATPDASPDARPALPAPRPGSGRILVMDDDALLRSLYERVLTSLGYECAMAADGASAVEQTRRALHEGRPFSLAILDLTIPGGMGGVETVGKLHELDPHLRAIVASGYSTDRTLEDPAGAGFAGVLRKPFTASALSLAISELMGETVGGN